MNTPFLKWPGGKRWLISSDHLPVPGAYQRYVEPFLGGGAVFFSLIPKKALLSDINSELITLYQVIKAAPEKLYAEMKRHQKKHCKEYYYSMRKYKPRSEIYIAARFLYLNRTCWNGLYRVNLKGQFNVPIGTKDSVLFEYDNFDKISQALENTEIKCSDFESVIDGCRKGDFLFLDPPYTVKHNHNGFVKYNENIFSWDDQIRLCNASVAAAARGVCIVITNADHSSVKSLYRKHFTYTSLMRHSKLAADSKKRSETTEAMFVANL